MKEIGTIKNKNKENKIFIKDYTVKSVSSEMEITQTGSLSVGSNNFGGYQVYDSRRLESTTTRTVFLSDSNNNEYFVYLKEGDIPLQVGSECSILFIKFNNEILIPQRIYNKKTKMASNILIDPKYLDVTSESKTPLITLTAILSFFSTTTFTDFEIVNISFWAFFITLFLILFSISSYLAFYVNVNINYFENINKIFKNHLKLKEPLIIEQENSKISNSIFKTTTKVSSKIFIVIFSLFSVLMLYGMSENLVNRGDIIEYAEKRNNNLDLKIALDDKYNELVHYARKDKIIGIDFTYKDFVLKYYQDIKGTDFSGVSNVILFPQIIGTMITLPKDIKTVNTLLSLKYKKGRVKKQSYEVFSKRYFNKNFNELNKEEFIFAYQVVAMGAFNYYSESPVSLTYKYPCKKYIKNYSLYEENIDIKNNSIYENCNIILNK